MDPGSGPPQQSPDDYSAREKRERTGVTIGIVTGVFLLFAVPFCLVYIANWRRRRKNRKKDHGLEGTTVASEKDGIGRSHRSFGGGETTLTATVVAPDEIEADKPDQAQQDPHGSTRVGPNPTQNISKQATTEEILGVDKASILRNLPIGRSRPDGTGSSGLEITALPARVPPLELPNLKGVSSTQDIESTSTEKCVSPWAVEHEPNPVIFKHLLSSPKDNPSNRASSELRNEETTLDEDRIMGEYSSWTVQPASSFDNGVDFARKETESDRSSPLEDTSGSSPSYTSQDSASPLMPYKSPQSLSPIVDEANLLHSASSSGYTRENMDEAGKPSCLHCKRAFQTMGQLK